ncbi:hypothetical protein FRC12_002074 [Ceratobasidium sp. 428]|nr:hypothetical protein FRC12_002074 [Ceratobasidium sp. 428]
MPILPTATTLLAALHFALLVARIISNEKDSLEERQSALRPLLNYYDVPSGRQEPTQFILRDMVLHIDESVRRQSAINSLRRTMQFMVNFCNSDVHPDLENTADDAVEHVDWLNKLQELKQHYQLKGMEYSLEMSEGV